MTSGVTLSGSWCACSIDPACRAAEKCEATAVAAQLGNKVGGIENARRWLRRPHHHTLGDTEFCMRATHSFTASLNIRC